MGRIYNSAYCGMLRDRERAKNPELKRSSKELSAIDDIATIADMLMFEAKGIKILRGQDVSELVKDNDIIKSVYKKYPDVYKFLSEMYNTMIDPKNADEEKVKDKDFYLETPLDHLLKILESIK